MKQVVIFGAGLVAPPMVRYLLDAGFKVRLIDQEGARAARLIASHPLGRENGQALGLDIQDQAEMRRQIAAADLVVSLLPAALHPRIAEVCVEVGRHLVTTSYVSPAMRALDGVARAKDLLLLNEMGVDPGLDHMSALALIHREEQTGKTLTGFTSWCGGLPAPEANDNPFGYKFSWSPRGVLLAAKNGARYLQDGRLVEIPPERLFAQPAQVDIPGLGCFEGYPNRDSVSYRETYGFGERVTTLLRGTLRNPGHCRLFSALLTLGLLEDAPRQRSAGRTARVFMEGLFGAPLEDQLARRIGQPLDSAGFLLHALRHVGLLDEKPLLLSEGSLLDIMVAHLQTHLAFQPGERDLLVMRHEFSFEDPAGHRERRSSLLIEFGQPHGDSAMARLVSLPAAIAVRRVLEGQVGERGVQIPIGPGLYEPILAELESLGVRFRETEVETL